MSSPQVTNLDMIMEVPWQDHFELGQGINGLTGKMAGRALEPIKPLQPTDLDHQRKSGKKFIRDLHDQHIGTRINTNATINLGFPVAFGAKFDYKHLSADSLSSSLIEYWIDGQYGLERVDAGDLKLTPKAKKCVGDPARFREQYGDYFICGFRRHYSFRCIVKCKENSDMHVRDVGAGANVGLGSLLEVGGDAGVSRSSKGVNGVESVYSSCYGCFPKSSTTYSTPFEVNSLEHAAKIEGEVEKLDFSERPGVRHIALLQHYSALENSLPKNVSVHRDVFSDLHRMDALYMALKLDMSHPSTDVQDLPDASDAITLFESERDTFVDDHDAREKAFQGLQKATEKLQKFLELYSHRLRIEKLLSKNGPPKAPKAGEPPARFGYGLAHDEKAISNEQCRPVRLEHGLRGWECRLVAKEERKEWNVLSRHYKTNLYFHGRTTRSIKQSNTEYSPTFSAAIVGFTLSCDNESDESVTFTIATGGILSSSLSVQVSAPYGREWHCRVFFVEDEFGCLASHN